MRRYFLTGCTGFLGKAIVTELASRDDTECIVLLSRNPDQRYHLLKISPKVKLVEGNILNAAFPGTHYTDVIHGANEPLGVEPVLSYYAMVEGTRRVVDWAMSLAPIPRIMLLSSGGVNRDTHYGHGKAMSELLVSRMGMGKIARIYTLVGDGVPYYYAIGNFIRQAMNSGLVRVFGGENIIRSYLHIEDAARWLLWLLDEGPYKAPVDVGGRHRISVADTARLVADVFGAEFSQEPACQDSDVYLPNVQQDFETITLRQALERIRDAARVRHTGVESAKAA